MCKTAAECEFMSVVERGWSSQVKYILAKLLIFVESGKIKFPGRFHGLWPGRHKLSRLMVRLFLPNWFLINSDQSLIGF